MIKIITDFPIALDSPDHLQPHGTAHDNHSSIDFINDIEEYFSDKKIKFLDIGCAGGQLVQDMYDRWHLAVGIEGSDYSLVNKRACWTDKNINKILFTCDASKKYSINFINENVHIHEQYFLSQNLIADNEQILFDCITANEVAEHIHINYMEQFFNNISNHLTQDGIFIASISVKNEELIEGYDLHQTVFPRAYWIENILSKINGMKIIWVGEVQESITLIDKNSTNINHFLRNDIGSFHIIMGKKI